jgi:hypothetical protein
LGAPSGFTANFVLAPAVPPITVKGQVTIKGQTTIP